METSTASPPPEALPQRKGIRQTEQRKAVLEALTAQADHPTAVDLFMRVKARVPSISLATVYNCLETLVESGVVRIVNHEREPSRFCANLAEHAHLFCTVCDGVTDLPLRKSVPPAEIWTIPAGARIANQNVAFRGICSRCASAPVNPPGATPSVAAESSPPPALPAHSLLQPPSQQPV
jgi:Fur family peroxide stress response transcriptional regulator